MGVLELLESMALFECMDKDDFDAVQCVKCGEIVLIDDDVELIHKPDCQLKATIDALRSGRLVVYAKSNGNAGDRGAMVTIKKEQG